MKKAIFAPLLGFLFLTGCASSVTTFKGPPDSRSDVDDVAYYLPKGTVKISGTWDKDTGLWDFSISTQIGPDLKQPEFYTSRHWLLLFDDDLTIGIDPTTELLQTANSTTTDQSINAVGNLTYAAFSAMGIPGTYSTDLNALSGGAETALDVAKEKHPKWSEVLKNARFSSFQTFLNPPSGKSTGVFYLKSPSTGGQATYAAFVIRLYCKAASSTVPQGNEFKGLLVRQPIPCGIIIEGYYHSDSDKTPSKTYTDDEFTSTEYRAAEQIVVLPDPSDTRVLPLFRRPFVTTTTKVTLANGMVQSFEENKPSILLGVCSIPKTLISDIIPVGGSGGGGGGGGASSTAQVSSASGAGGVLAGTGAGTSGTSQTPANNPSQTPPILQPVDLN